MHHQRLLRSLIVGALIGSASITVQAHAAAADSPDARGNSRPAAVLIKPNLAGTVALPVDAQRYSASWERARRHATGNARLQHLIAPARALNRAQQIAYVQAAVDRQIRWISDATEWGRHDYWASADETLNRGAGDMEDRAILKMEALKNLGVPDQDLYLTMGRDKVAGPITVLIARIDGRYFLFDDSAAVPKPIDYRPDFEPILTFGHGGAWIHGRRIAPQQIAAKTGAGADAAQVRARPR